MLQKENELESYSMVNGAVMRKAVLSSEALTGHEKGKACMNPNNLLVIVMVQSKIANLD